MYSDYAYATYVHIDIKQVFAMRPLRAGMLRDYRKMHTTRAVRGQSKVDREEFNATEISAEIPCSFARAVASGEKSPTMRASI